MVFTHARACERNCVMQFGKQPYRSDAVDMIESTTAISVFLYANAAMLFSTDVDPGIKEMVRSCSLSNQ